MKKPCKLEVSPSILQNNIFHYRNDEDGKYYLAEDMDKYIEYIQKNFKETS